MKYADGDCNVVISADLQDPPELILNMYEYWQKGVKLVLANRANREDALFDKLFAKRYHKLIKKYAIPNMPDGGFDFCLFDRKLKDEVTAINEKNTNTLFLLVWLKYDFVSIPYTRRERKLGKSRWTFDKKIKLLIDSFAAFSYFPIRLISIMGFLFGFAAIIYAITILVVKLMGNIQLEGWTTLMLVFLFVSAFQTIAIGIIGEYLWRTLDASRNRPTYVVDEVI
jgi:glycosyltransferase involved in cell wall biosynthesis